LTRRKDKPNIECNCERADYEKGGSKEFKGCECSLVFRVKSGKIVKRSQIKSIKANNMIVEWNTSENEYGDYT
jgi:hypothetical protein